MSACEQNPKEKAATLTLALRADSGYEADAEYRVSAEQWADVLGVCEGTRPVPAAPVSAQQAGPVLLTDEVIERLWYSSRGISTLFARAIETSILERNGLKPQAKGD